MAKHLSVLRGFSIAGDDGSTDLEHHYQDCDWREWADGRSLPELMRLASKHAKVCDGKPQPRRPQQESAFRSLTMSLWGPLITETLKRGLVTGTPNL